MLVPLIAAAAWIGVGAVLLYAKSRGRLADWERNHPVLSTITYVVVGWAALGWLIFLVVLANAAALVYLPRAMQYVAAAILVAGIAWFAHARRRPPASSG